MLHSYRFSPKLPLTAICSTSLSLTTSSLFLSSFCSTIDYPSLPNPQSSFPSLCLFSLSFTLSLSVSPHLLISFPLPNALTQPLLLSPYLSISHSPNASPVHPISHCLGPSPTPTYFSQSLQFVRLQKGSLYFIYLYFPIPNVSIYPPLSHPHPLSNCPFSSSSLIIPNILQ